MKETMENKNSNEVANVKSTPPHSSPVKTKMPMREILREAFTKDEGSPGETEETQPRFIEDTSNIDPDDISKINPTEEKTVMASTPVGSTAESTLRTLGTIALCVGLLATVILLITVVFADGEFNLAGLAMTIGTGLYSVLTWAVLQVIANISSNLFEIKDALKKK